MVDEKDAQATALGYVEDATRADKVKFKTYVAGSQCSGWLPAFSGQERGGQGLVQAPGGLAQFTDGAWLGRGTLFHPH